jgi:predicted metal-binding protein
MKKTILTTGVAIAIALGLGSCTKCEVCTKTNSPEIRVCAKDYNTTTQYNLVLDGYQGNGYVCKSSI